MASKTDIICADGTFYIETAKSLDRVDAQNRQPAELFNLYPHVLLSLHHLGVDWETAGKFWGVLCGTLTVLPLFGWIRRQFNDRTAIVACVLLAVHPKLVEWSPEMVRDPTFCLTLCLAVYCSWRAASEVRPIFFLLAGIVTVLSMQLRFEGWFLLIPVVLWSFWRMLALSSGRLRLTCGAAAFVLAFPLTIWGFNLAYGDYYSTWILGGNLRRLNYLKHWKTEKTEVAKVTPNRTAPKKVQYANSSAPVPTNDSDPKASASPAIVQVAANEPIEPSARSGVSPPLERQAHMSNRWASWLTLRTIFRGFTPIHALLTLLGLFAARRTWLRGDQQPMFYYLLIVAAGMWLHTWEAKASSSRYALSLVLVAAPFMALGLLAIVKRLSEYFQRAGDGAANPAALPAFAGKLTAGCLLLIAAICCTDSLLGSDANRQPHYSLGAWLLREFGPQRQIAGPRSMNLAGYYAQSKYLVLTAEPLSDLVEKSHPDVILLARAGVASNQLELAIANLMEMEYRQIDDAHLPTDCRRDVVVLVKQLLQARNAKDMNQR